MTKSHIRRLLASAPKAAADCRAYSPQASPAQAEPEEDIAFTPVPVRARRDGWSPERQQEFVRALRRIGSIATAARCVGMSARSVHKLLARPGAESFAAACDDAMEQGFYNVQDHVIDRALNGAVVPRFYKGRQTGVMHRFYDAIPIAVLSGGGASLRHRLRQAEERGSRQSYFNIERAWREDLEDLKMEMDRRIAAEEKLRRLVAAGLIDRSWLDEEQPALAEVECPARPGPQPQRRIPRIRQL